MVVVAQEKSAEVHRRLALHRSTVVTLATPASSTGMGTALAANDRSLSICSSRSTPDLVALLVYPPVVGRPGRRMADLDAYRLRDG